MLKDNPLLKDITKQWLEECPYVPNELPKGWEVRFDRRGMFYKYGSIEEAESRNMIVRRDMSVAIPFGYVNKEWEDMKSMMQEADEIWRAGGDGWESIMLVRQGGIINEMMLKVS